MAAPSAGDATSRERPHSPVAAWLAAAWPALAALVCAAFALWPGWFPAATGRWIAFAAVAELPALFLGAVHAIALREGRRGQRYYVFGIGLGVLLLAGGAHLAWELAFSDLAPMLGWMLVGMLVELHADPADPQLAHDRAWAVLNDRATLLALLPVVLIGALLLAIAAHLLSPLLSGDGFDGWLNARLQAVQGHHAAWLAVAWLTLVAASTAHAHGRAFLIHRRRLLDRPWIDRLTRRSGRS